MSVTDYASDGGKRMSLRGLFRRKEGKKRVVVVLIESDMAVLEELATLCQVRTMLLGLCLACIWMRDGCSLFSYLARIRI